MAYKKCKHGHLRTPDNVNAQGQCKKCKAISNKQWANDNPIKDRASKIKWRNANPDKQRKAAVAWEKANPDKVKARRKRNYIKYAKVRREYSRQYYKTHPNPTYHIWRAMMTRCYNLNSTSYPQYGAIGVRVCKRWHKFKNFLADLGPRPSKNHSLSRLGDTGDYKPGNVIWGTRAHQKLQARIKRELRTQLPAPERAEGYLCQLRNHLGSLLKESGVLAQLHLRTKRVGASLRSAR